MATPRLGHDLLAAFQKQLPPFLLATAKGLLGNRQTIAVHGNEDALGLQALVNSGHSVRINRQFAREIIGRGNAVPSMHAPARNGED